MALAMVLMAAVYYVYSLSAASFRISGQMVGAMERARFALDQLRRDMALAGFLATPNSMADPDVCRKPNPPLHGIAFQQGLGAVPGLGNDVVNAGTGPNDNQNISPAAVILLGPWWSTNIYTISRIDSSGTQVFFTPDGMPPPGPNFAAQFQEIFRPGRFLRVTTQEQFQLYGEIASASPSTMSVTLTPSTALPIAVPPDLCGYQGDGSGLEAAVVGYVRYRLRQDDRASAPPGKVDLIREELDANFQVVAASALVVSEYVVDLQFYDFVRDRDTTRRDPDIVVTPLIGSVLSGPGGYGTDTLASPQRLRAVTVKVTARTEDEDPSVNFVPRASPDAPLDFYQVDPVMEGAARTVTLAARVSFRQFAVRSVL